MATLVPTTTYNRGAAWTILDHKKINCFHIFINEKMWVFVCHFLILKLLKTRNVTLLVFSQVIGALNATNLKAIVLKAP